MDEAPIPNRDEGDQLFQRLLARYDVPAYIRRAQQVQAAFDQLVNHCRQQREKWLSFVRLRLGRLQALSGDWDKLRALCVRGEGIQSLRELHAALAPRLRVPVEQTSSPRVLRHALQELTDSIERFNRRWQAFMQGIDLTHVNQLRDDYNRYFVLEKECAVRSSRVARQGFVRLEPVTAAELAALLPPLPVPRCGDSA
jgi:hypothetical protein